MSDVVVDPAVQPPATPPAVVAPAVVVPPVVPPVAPAPVVVVPDTYDLTLPADSKLDPAIVDRTAAIARARGLSNEAGQELLNSIAGELATHETAVRAAVVAEQQEAMKPGGALWQARDAEWRAAALADKDIGGTPENMVVSTEKAQQALGKYATPALKGFLKETGLGSHPEVIRLFARLGRAMSEGSIVQGANQGGTGERRPTHEVMYGADGLGPKSTPTT